MSETVTIKVPDIGDFADVEVIEVLVAPGDTVTEEQSLITLESDKASMEVPAPRAGKVVALQVAVGDRVAEGSPILELDPAAAAETSTPAPAATSEAPAATPSAAPEGATPRAAPDSGGQADHSCQLVVLGAGPGGYTAAFRAADLGLDVILVERYPRLGGVCLNVGCIPSKALLHTAAIISEAQEMAAHGITFGAPKIDLDRLRGFKDGVIGQLTKGLAGLARQRQVRVLQGEATFSSPHELALETGDGRQTIRFDHAIIAAGSQSARIPGLPYDDPRLIDSTGALELPDIPGRLLVIGGGIIGLEMACVYAALGSRVSVVELTGELIPGADRDLVRPLEKRIRARYENIWLDTRVTGIKALKKGLKVSFEGGKAPADDTFDRVLLAVGRTPNGRAIGAEAAGVEVDERGFIPVDDQQRTNVAHIFAIGDIVGQPMLAHKATHEGKVAAEVIAGMKSRFDARTIPSVAYTDPEVAWMGLTETAAKAQGIAYEKGAFPWAASGRSLSIGRSEGLTKVLVDPASKRILGAGMVGPNAGELIAAATLALEMGADVEDVALTIHPHPTLSETFNFACEVVEGTVTDLYVPKKR
jgi:dihydrolipoamide dehydrogenase